jgi:SOS response regulatory protein OraA/RecX
MTNGAEEKLARVTYLPGVQPSSAPLVVPEQSLGEPVSLDSIPGLRKASELGEPAPVRRSEVPRSEVPRTSDRAHNVSLNALTRRGISVAELIDLLRRRGLDELEIVSEIDRLDRVGLLDDEQLARTLVRTLTERKGLGRSAVRAELLRRKIDQQTANEAIEEIFEDEGLDDLSRARALAVKRAPQLRSLDPETARRRLGAFLMRKGYSGSIVSSAVATALAPNHPSVRRSSTDGPRFS